MQLCIMNDHAIMELHDNHIKSTRWYTYHQWWWFNSLKEIPEVVEHILG